MSHGISTATGSRGTDAGLCMGHVVTGMVHTDPQMFLNVLEFEYFI